MGFMGGGCNFDALDKAYGMQFGDHRDRRGSRIHQKGRRMPILGALPPQAKF